MIERSEFAVLDRLRLRDDVNGISLKGWKLAAAILCTALVTWTVTSSFRSGKDLKESQDHAAAITTPSRAADFIDTLTSYAQTPNCTVSSLDLHKPFEPLCQDMESLLKAMSGGGRAGFDQPYQPLGCDMRWYDIDEICNILDRFEEVILLGDSMTRGLTVALQVLVRQDLFDGGRPNWQNGTPVQLDMWETPDKNFTADECHCQDMYKTECRNYILTSSRVAREKDPVKNYCDNRRGASKFIAGIEYTEIGAVPVPNKRYNKVINARSKTKPQRPYAWVMGHGLRNNVNVTASQEWTTTLMKELRRLPYYKSQQAFIPRLFITPNSDSSQKQDLFLPDQGSEHLQKFEIEMGAWVKTQGFDHLGTWNLTTQVNMPDGLHPGMLSELAEAQMVLNWLDHLDTSRWNRGQ